MAGLPHGNSTPTGISCGRPHCVILLSGRAVAGRKYHYPCRDPRETARLRLFYGQIKPLVIFAVILFPRGPTRMSHGVSTGVAFPVFGQRQLTYLGYRILSCQRTGRAKEKGPHYLCSFRGILTKNFFDFFRHSIFRIENPLSISPHYLCNFGGTLHGIFSKLFRKPYFERKSPSFTSMVSEEDEQILLLSKPLNFNCL